MPAESLTGDFNTCLMSYASKQAVQQAHSPDCADSDSTKCSFTRQLKPLMHRPTLNHHKPACVMLILKSQHLQGSSPVGPCFCRSIPCFEVDVSSAAAASAGAAHAAGNGDSPQEAAKSHSSTPPSGSQVSSKDSSPHFRTHDPMDDSFAPNRPSQAMTSPPGTPQGMLKHESGRNTSSSSGPVSPQRGTSKGFALTSLVSPTCNSRSGALASAWAGWVGWVLLTGHVLLQ